MPPDLSVIIVNYNTKDLLQLCLENVFCKIKNVSFEVIVVDNASNDGSPAMAKTLFPKAKLIENTANTGFASANNTAIRQSKGEFVLLLNPDCLLLDNVEKAVAFLCENQEIGALGLKLLNTDGSLQHSCRRFPTISSLGFGRTGFFTNVLPNNPLSKNYLMLDFDHEKTSEVDWVSGAAMLLRKKALEEVGLLDEQFFLFCEDIDICYRLHAAGWQTSYFPLVRAVHYVGQSVKKNHSKIILEHHKSMYLFLKKYYNPGLLERVLVLTGMTANIAYLIVQKKAEKIFPSISTK